MAQLSIRCCPSSSSSSGANATGVDIQRLVLVRTGGHVDANTTIDITNPGTGWVTFGDPVTISGADEFTELTQVFRNGVIQLTAASASDNHDVYFVAASGSIAFEYKLHTNDVVQVWKFNPTTTSG
jgi:hypothetical protein